MQNAVKPFFAIDCIGLNKLVNPKSPESSESD
jgi:hypothetical protein